MKKLLPLTRQSRFMSIAVLVFTMVAMSSAAIAASLTSDQSHYYPGSTATLTGSGFQGGEIVTLQVVHADGSGDNSEATHQPWNVHANANGNFVTTWEVNEDGDQVGALLLATADGQSSGSHAETTFTDDAPFKVFFTTTGLPDGSTVDVLADYYNNGGHLVNHLNSFLSPGPSGPDVTDAGTEFNFTFPATVLGSDNLTYVLVSTSASGPFTTGASGDDTTINGTYELSDCQCTPPTNITINSIGNDQIEVCWDAQDCAQGYILQYQWKGHQNWNTIDVTAPDHCGTIDLLGHTDVNIQVATVCQDGSVTEFSSTSNYRYNAPCTAPTNLTTTNISASSATFNWTPGTTTNVQKVRYQVLHTTTSIVLAFPNATASGTTVSGLIPSTKYKWKVKGDCWSEYVRFTTAAQKLNEQSSAGNLNQLSVYPNPASQKFYVDIQMNDQQDCSVVIEVVNMLGQVIFSNKDIVSTGHSVSTIDLGSQVADGLYVLRVISGDQSMEQRIVISNNR